MSKQPLPAPTASAVGPCPTVIQIIGRPSTGSLPSTIHTARPPPPPPPPPPPCLKSRKSLTSVMSKLFVGIRCSLFQRFLGLIRLSTHSKNLTRHLDLNQGRLCLSQLFRFQNLNIVLIQNKRNWLYQFPGMFLLTEGDLVVLQIIRQC